MIDPILFELRQIKELLQAQEIHAKDLMTMLEASSFLELSMSTMYHLTSNRKIPHYRPTNGKIYLRRIELEAWMLQNPKPTIIDLPAKGRNYLLNTKKRFAA
jgi:excisionase family DNA binding protein